MQLTHRRSGYRSASETLAARAVRAPSTTTIRVVGRQGQASVHVGVVAPAAAAVTSIPEGQVTIQVKNRIKTLTLSQGSVSATFVGFRPGTYPVAVTYRGSGTATVSKAVGTVQVS